MKRVVFIAFITIQLATAQVGIGTNSPEPAAILDVSSSNQGMLVPRLQLQSTTDTTTIIGTEVNGLLVYNLGAMNDVTPGFYYWNGSWTKLSTGVATGSSNGWNMQGNAATTPGTDYLGTTDAQDLVFKTNDTEALRVLANGNVGINNINPTSKLSLRQNGTTTAVDLTIGDPATAPGPGNTTNQFPVLDINHMATGNSLGAGTSKSAIFATNHSEDPTIFAQNLTTTTDGAVIQASITPTAASAALSIAVYGIADRNPTNGYGVGLRGDGGNYGVIGGTSTNAASSDFGLLSLTNSGAFGVKSFIIDYPLDPANKILKHYSIESNEVLNKYRGNVKFNAAGRAVVELPEYFQEVNIHPTYQLTAIGSATSPYIFKKIERTSFIIAGEPFTEVSWEVTAQRNDPTVNYINQYSDLNNEISDKNDREKGKYYVPGAYGKDAAQGVFYRKPIKAIKE